MFLPQKARKKENKTSRGRKSLRAEINKIKNKEKQDR